MSAVNTPLPTLKIFSGKHTSFIKKFFVATRDMQYPPPPEERGGRLELPYILPYPPPRGEVAGKYKDLTTPPPKRGQAGAARFQDLRHPPPPQKGGRQGLPHIWSMILSLPFAIVNKP